MGDTPVQEFCGCPAPEQGEGQVTEASAEERLDTVLRHAAFTEWMRKYADETLGWLKLSDNAIARGEQVRGLMLQSWLGGVHWQAERTQDKEPSASLEAALREAHHNPQPIDWKRHDESACEVCVLLAPPGQKTTHPDSLRMEPAFVKDVAEKFEHDTKPALDRNAAERGEEAQHGN